MSKKPSATLSPADDFLHAAVVPRLGDHRQGTLDDAEAIRRANPEITVTNLFAACAYGDWTAARTILDANPKLATRKGGIRAWLPLSYLCFSKYLRLDRKRSGDFLKIAARLLAEGADANTFFVNDGGEVKESALYGASGVANDAALTKLLLDHGANVDDGESLYHASEFEDHACLRLLLDAKPPAELMTFCMCHSMDREDAGAVRIYLRAGTNVNAKLKGGVLAGVTPLHFAIYRRRSGTVLRLLIDAGAKLDAKTTTGLTPYAMAMRLGLADTARLLVRKGASTELSAADTYVAALASGRSHAAKRLLAGDPSIAKLIKASDYKLLVNAAEAGHLSAIKAMVAAGFPIETGGAMYGGWDGTALHHAAWNGRADAVKLLLKLGADPKLKHAYGGDALSTAQHGAIHSRSGGDFAKTIAVLEDAATATQDL